MLLQQCSAFPTTRMFFFSKTLNLKGPHLSTQPNKKKVKSRSCQRLENYHPLYCYHTRKPRRDNYEMTRRSRSDADKPCKRAVQQGGKENARTKDARDQNNKRLLTVNGKNTSER